VEPDHIKVIFAVVVIWGLLIATCRFAACHDKRTPADDIGIMWLVVLTVYCTLPPVSWLLQGGLYSILSFQRLLFLQPTSAEVLRLMYISVAYAAGFSGVYCLLRGSVPQPCISAHARIDGPQITGALVFVVTYLTLTMALRFGGYIREAESYADEYRTVQELPLGLRQVMKIASGFAAMSQLVLLVAVLQRWPRSRSVYILYLAMILFSYDPSGSRKAIAIGFLSAAVAWHILVRPIAARRWIMAGVMGFVVFTVLGALRGLGVWDSGGGEIAGSDFEGLGLGELDALWANAVHLLQEGNSKLDIPIAARYGEFWAFIPSQFLPFEKLALNDWYLDTYFPEYKEGGGGWEFGAVTQAVIGGGIAEAAVRGCVVGLLSVSLMTWYRARTATWWRLPLYLYIFTLAFLSIRDTTFRPFAEFVQLAVPALCLIELIAELVSSDNRRPVAAHPRTAAVPRA
jgi:hypothetical protein